MDPYESGVLEKLSKPFHDKRIISARIVAVLRGKVNNRGLLLIKEKSRVLKKGDIIELITTDEVDASPGNLVNNVAYISFAEVTTGGVVIRGDEVVRERGVIGKVVGFDETHMPNHMNVVLCHEKIEDGSELCLSVEERINLRMNSEEVE
jgi:hypothetical protein